MADRTSSRSSLTPWCAFVKYVLLPERSALSERCHVDVRSLSGILPQYSVYSLIVKEAAVWSAESDF